MPPIRPPFAAAESNSGLTVLSTRVTMNLGNAKERTGDLAPNRIL
jgi:hypothetical protein